MTVRLPICAMSPEALALIEIGSPSKSVIDSSTPPRLGLADVARGAGAEREHQDSESQESSCEFHMGILPLGS